MKSSWLQPLRRSRSGSTWRRGRGRSITRIIKIMPILLPRFLFRKVGLLTAFSGRIFAYIKISFYSEVIIWFVLQRLPLYSVTATLVKVLCFYMRI